MGDVQFSSMYDHAAVVADITPYSRLPAGVMLQCGGDHQTYPILKAFAADNPVALVHIDAHTDAWDEFGLKTCTVRLSVVLVRIF